MKITIIGGGGFLGQKLAKALAKKGELRGRRIASMVLADTVDPVPVEAPFPVTTRRCDICERGQVDAAIAGADVIYHLAAIVSAQAEAEFDLGLDINLMGSLNVFQAARALETCPVVVFTSSVAVYGGDVPEMLEDWTALNPQTSYGAQKAAAELILTDMSRKGFIDGRGLRLPTITVRPGRPNKASTGFMSSIFREPLQGESANCPVDRNFEVWHCSPRAVIRNLIHAAEVEAEALGRNRCFALPGRTDTIGEMVDAMARIAGPESASRITWEADPWIEGIVREFRTRLNPQKALDLGFTADSSFEDNIRFFLEDDIRRG